MDADLRDARDTIASLKGWIDHWTEDRRCGLLPTEGALSAAYREADRALVRIDTIAGLHLPRATVLSAEPGPDLTIHPITQDVESRV